MNTAVKKMRLSPIELLKKYSVVLTLIIMIILATILTGGSYFSSSNMINVGERAAAIGIIALGQMLVILTGGMDLSVSSIVSVGYCITAILLKNQNIPIPLVIILMLLATTACGAVNGLLVSLTNVSPFMLTLGTQMFFSSLALVISKAENLFFNGQTDWMVANWHLDGLGGRLFPTVMWLVFSVIIILILAYTRFGKNIYQTGGKELAARLSGIRTSLIKFSVYAVCGFLCGVAALTIEFRLNSSNVTTTSGYMMSSIAAVVVGGTSLKGGEGNVYGTLIGAFIMASLDNIMNLVSLDVYSQDVVKGIVLLAFVLFSYKMTQKKIDE